VFNETTRSILRPCLRCVNASRRTRVNVRRTRRKMIRRFTPAERGKLDSPTRLSALRSYVDDRLLHRSRTSNGIERWRNAIDSSLSIALRLKASRLEIGPVPMRLSSPGGRRSSRRGNFLFASASAGTRADTSRASDESFRQAGHESADTNGNYKCPARSFTREGNTRGSLLRVRLRMCARARAHVALAKERGGARRVSLTSLWIPAVRSVFLRTEHSAHCEDPTARESPTMPRARSLLLKIRGKGDDHGEG